MTEPAAYSLVTEKPKSRIDEQIERSRIKRLAKREAHNQKGVTPEHLKPHLFQPGVRQQSVSARGKLNARFMSALVDDFEKHGKRAIERMRIHDPSGYIKTVAFLMPKQFEQTTPMQDLTDEELERGIEFLKSKLAVSDGTGVRAAALIEQDSGVQALPQAD